MKIVETLMHPVRMKIYLALIGNQDKGLTPLEMLDILKDVPQATLYRHIQVLLEADIIHVIKEKKVKAVSEKYYALNKTEKVFGEKEWSEISKEEKLNYISYYQLVLLSKYQGYLDKLEDTNNQEDTSTFSVLELKLNKKQFSDFQNELNELMKKYYHYQQNSHDANNSNQTIGITIIPDSK